MSRLYIAENNILQIENLPQSLKVFKLQKLSVINLFKLKNVRISKKLSDIFLL